MALKLTHFLTSKKIPKRVNLNSLFSTTSCAELYTENNPKASDFESKIQFLRQKLVPDTLIHVLDNTNDITSALNIFKWASLQPRYSHTVETYYRIILKLGLAGNVDEMEGFCRGMVTDRCPGVKDAMVSLIRCFVGYGRLDEAVRVLRIMKVGGFRLSLDVFNVLLSGLVDGKRSFRDVLFVYKEMVKDGVVPNVDTLNCLLEALFDEDCVEAALEQYRRFGKKECNPNSRTFEVLIRGLVVNDRVEEAVSALDEMFELDIKPEFSFYRCAIELFCKENRREEGMKLYKMMKDSGFVPDYRIYLVLIRCLCRELFLDDAIKLLEEMMDGGLLPDDDGKVFVYIVQGLCRVGKINEAIELLEDRNVVGTLAYNALLQGCCNAGKFCVAKDILERMSERNIANCDSWNILISCLCEKVGIKKALELAGKMIVSSLAPNNVTFSAFILNNCRSKKINEAYELFRQIQANCWVLDAISYSELIKGLCGVGKILEAADLFCYMSGNGSNLQASSFNILIEGICDMGWLSKAVKLRLLATNSGTTCTDSTYAIIMLALSKAGKASDLLVLLSQMLVQGHAMDLQIYRIIIKTVAIQNQAKHCAIFFRRMIAEGWMPDSVTLDSALSCLCNHSQLHLVSSAIEKLVSVDDALDSTTYNILINGLWKEGYKSEAGHLLDLMLEKGWVPNSTTHKLLIGSVGRAKTDQTTWPVSNYLEDNVNEILAEGLENM